MSVHLYCEPQPSGSPGKQGQNSGLSVPRPSRLLDTRPIGLKDLKMSKPNEVFRSTNTVKTLFHRSKARFLKAGPLEKVMWLTGATLLSPMISAAYAYSQIRKRQKLHFVRSLKKPPAAAVDLDAEKHFAAEPNTFALVRIIGNDLPPRHDIDQSLYNLDFVLRNEPDFKHCQKLWIINRITDKKVEQRIKARLDAAGAIYAIVPFNSKEYEKIPLDFSLFNSKQFLHTAWFQNLDIAQKSRAVAQILRLKNLYVMNNNGARNIAIAIGARHAKWILPFDGNCFLTLEDWEKLYSDVVTSPDRQYFVVPMLRLGSNEHAIDNISPKDASDEPQIMFRRDAPERFDEKHPYGRRPKVELLARLGVPGPWVKWPMEPWDLPGRPVGQGVHRTGQAGLVRRLASGREDLEQSNRKVTRVRGMARADAIVANLLKADRMLLFERGFCPDSPVFFDRNRLASLGQSDPVARVIADETRSAMTRGPYSTTHKTELPPSGNLNDYYHPAPYWHPNPRTASGLPYVRRDGVRSPGTSMHGEGSGKYDRTRWQMMCDDALVCALSWIIWGNQEARDHAKSLIEQWFIDPKTAMTPHLRYAQVRHGHDDGEGKGAGIIEFKDLVFLLDAIRLLDDFDLKDKMLTWTRKYYEWLSSSPQGIKECHAYNNHGVYFDLQYVAAAAFLGDAEGICKSWMNTASRISGHFDCDGSQPNEIKRTLSKHYCLYNLQGWLTLLQLYQKCGIPIHHQPEIAEVEKGVHWLISQRNNIWQYRQIDYVEEDRFLPIVFGAARVGFRIDISNADKISARDKIKFDSKYGVPPYWKIVLA